MGNKSLAAVAAELKRAVRPVLAGHVLPDGDSVGSTLALGLMLEQLGKKVRMVSQDPIPPMYRFLPGVAQIRVGTVPDADYDCLVTLDCSSPERLGTDIKPLLSRPGLRVVNIDHHISTGRYGDLNHIDPAAAAVGEIVFDLAEPLGVEISPEVSVCLYVAIATDTGSFRYENTTAGTHRRIARLIEMGLDAAAVNTRIFDEKPLAAIRLLHRVLGTLALSAGGRIAWLKLTRAMEAESGEEADVEDLINYARRISGVEVGILFRELPEGQIKVGFRSKRAVDVAALAAVFGGGGHPRAAGCRLAGELAEAERLVLGATEKVVAEALDGRSP
ncbi:MAG: bifunctional oligoribonuclease/PAP phosphatase NrnA [Bacillota bacterium]